jgi:hypothetical protein
MKVGEGMKTKPTKFKSAKQLIELWQEFCDEIVEAEFYTIPSQTSFCKWLTVHYEGTDRKTIYNSLNKIFPDIKKDFEAIRADVIAEGSMLGKYNSTMSIFALKNWCKWTDKQEVTQETKLAVSDNFLDALSDSAAEDWESDEDETVEDSSV